MRRIAVSLPALVLIVACGSSGDGEADGDAQAAGRDGSAADAVPPVASACADDQFATGIGADGKLECASIAAVATAAVDDGCSVYLGWNDGCDGCTDPPSKWGRASGASCENGVGSNDTCVSATLGGVDVELFGLDLGGDVDDDDTLYFGWSCPAAEEAPADGPCPAGSFASAVAPIACVAARDLVLAYAHAGCAVYAGFLDGCDGCSTAPAKWGRVTGDACANGAGLDDTCIDNSLGAPPVQLFGLNMDGDVDDDDKLHVGFQCDGATADESLVDGACPDGQLVVAVEEDGRVRCASPLPAAQAALRSSCQVYLGWRGDCDGCTDAPAKWGRAGHASCENGLGLDGTCATIDLDDVAVQLFGLSLDGDVDDNDKLYLGFTCP